MDRNIIWEMSQKCGGVFKFTVLLQKRIRELINGAPKLIETDESNVIQVALMEIAEGKVSMVRLTEEEIEQIKAQAASEREDLGGSSDDSGGSPGDRPIDPTATVRELLSK